MSDTLELAEAGPEGARLLRRAEQMIAAGRPRAGRPLLAAVERIGGHAEAVADLRARAAIFEDRLDEAVAVLDPAVAAHPGSALLRRRRAEALGKLERYGEAARDAAEAVLLDPSDAAARAMLGVMLLLLGHLPEACACLSDALAREPGHVGFTQALADAQERGGAADAAERTLRAGVAAAPGSAPLRTRLALLLARAGDWAGVAETVEAARRDGLAEATAFALLGQALRAAGRREAAEEAFAEALKLAPDDPGLRELSAARSQS